MRKKLLIQSAFLLFFISTFGVTGTKLIERGETIHFVLDRDTYIPGEFIWFKIYCKKKGESTNHKSRLTFVELINPAGQVVARKKVLLNNETGYGNFDIPDTVSTGLYNVIAYTLRSINQEFYDISQSSILIYNKEKEKHILSSNRPKNLIISSENNKLVAEITNRLYFNSNYSPKYIEIIGSNGDTLKSFNNVKIDFIEFTPSPNTFYYMNVVYNDTIIRDNLPKVEDYGMIFNLEEIDDNKFVFKVQSSNSIAYFNPDIAVYLNSNLQSSVLLKLNENKQYFEINKNELLSGINKIFVKSSDNNTLWERIIFNNLETYNLEILDAKNIYESKSKVNFRVSSNNTLTSISESNICISISKISSSLLNDSLELNQNNMQFAEEFYTNDIVSLNKEILFTSKNEFLDDTSNSEEFGDINNRISIVGSIVDNNGNPIPNINLMLNNVDSITRISITKTDKNGDFVFSVFPDRPKRDFVINPETALKNAVLINDKYINDYSFLRNTRNIDTSAKILDFYKDLYINTRIQKVYNQKYRTIDEYLLNPEWNNYDFFDNPDIVLEFNDFIELDSIHEYFHELVPFVKVTTNKEEKVVRIIDEKTGQFIPGLPAFFIDGVLYPDSKQFMELDPKNCSKLSVVRSRYLINNRIYSGIISISTKNGNLENVKLPLNAARIEFSLFDKSDIFHFEPTNKYIPDFRNTLFWNPEIIINSGEERLIEFFTSYDRSYYEIKIDGFTEDGRIIKERKIFKVE